MAANDWLVLIFVYKFCVNAAFTFFSICFAAHVVFLFQFTFPDAPLYHSYFLTPGGVVPPYPGLLIYCPFRALFYKTVIDI